MTTAIRTRTRCTRSSVSAARLRALIMEITIDDPKAYVKPWNATVHFDLLPDTELIESVCDNNKDVPHHMVGK